MGLLHVLALFCIAISKVTDATNGQSYPPATLNAIAKAWPTDLPRVVDYRNCLTKIKKQVGGSCHQYAQDVTMEAQLCLARGGKKAMLDINDFWSCKNYGNLVKTELDQKSPGPDLQWWRALHGAYVLSEENFDAAEAAAQNCSAIWGGHNGINATTIERLGSSVEQCGCKRSAAAAPSWPNDIGHTGLGTRTASARVLLPATESLTTKASRWPNPVAKWGSTRLRSEGLCADTASCTQLSLSDCRAASKQMGLNGVVGNASNPSPHGCYKYGNHLFFNDGSVKATNCTAKRSCICACKKFDMNIMGTSKNARTCVQARRNKNLDGWMNELWLARLIAKFGPSWIESFVMGFEYGTPSHPQAECLKTDYHKSGHNYPILGYNATDLTNAYWILGNTESGYSGDKKRDTTDEQNWGFTFKKMFNYCRSSNHLPGTYGIAAGLRVATMCPSDKDVRSASWGGGNACNATDRCLVDEYHHE